MHIIDILRSCRHDHNLPPPSVAILVSDTNIPSMGPYPHWSTYRTKMHYLHPKAHSLRSQAISKKSVSKFWKYIMCKMVDSLSQKVKIMHFDKIMSTQRHISKFRYRKNILRPRAGTQIFNF